MITGAPSRPALSALRHWVDENPATVSALLSDPYPLNSRDLLAKIDELNKKIDELNKETA